MTTHDLHALLEGLDDSHEVVLGADAGAPQATSELFAVWCAARAEANDAYAAWRAQPGARGYSVYRAAEDRADAAEAALRTLSGRPLG
jgi:hypothetical protein